MPASVCKSSKAEPIVRSVQYEIQNLVKNADFEGFCSPAVVPAQQAEQVKSSTVDIASKSSPEQTHENRILDDFMRKKKNISKFYATFLEHNDLNDSFRDWKYPIFGKDLMQNYSYLYSADKRIDNIDKDLFVRRHVPNLTHRKVQIPSVDHILRLSKG
jgi:hypothetical protein